MTTYFTMITTPKGPSKTGELVEKWSFEQGRVPVGRVNWLRNGPREQGLVPLRRVNWLRNGPERPVPAHRAISQPVHPSHWDQSLLTGAISQPVHPSYWDPPLLKGQFLNQFKRLTGTDPCSRGPFLNQFTRLTGTIPCSKDHFSTSSPVSLGPPARGTISQPAHPSHWHPSLLMGGHFSTSSPVLLGPFPAHGGAFLNQFIRLTGTTLLTR